ncbi:hypothetical protein [Microbacterium sp. A84]|uniref:hypothetical protein n=1 Tax=Microbacterium sp. A84 TaxID=3450715 RepID=UPI003F443D1A
MTAARLAAFQLRLDDLTAELTELPPGAELRLTLPRPPEETRTLRARIAPPLGVREHEVLRTVSSGRSSRAPRYLTPRARCLISSLTRATNTTRRLLTSSMGVRHSLMVWASRRRRVMLALRLAVEAEAAVAQMGASIHSVINALNVVLVVNVVCTRRGSVTAIRHVITEAGWGRSGLLLVGVGQVTSQ